MGRGRSDESVPIQTVFAVVIPVRVWGNEGGGGAGKEGRGGEGLVVRLVLVALSVIRPRIGSRWHFDEARRAGGG